MPRKSQLSLATQEILNHFEQTAKNVYSSKELGHVLEENRSQWRLALHTSLGEFIWFLEQEGHLQQQTFRSPAFGRKITRYSRGNASLYELAQSLDSRGYLSHIGALAIHGLIDANLNALYLNVEQTPKPHLHAALTQNAIDQAFSRKQRESRLTFTNQDKSVTIINGKHTDRLDVQEALGPQHEVVQATSVERTLIDIAVRPAYAGGISQVLEAYKRARNRVSIDKVIHLLDKLAYVYPYHQAVGFLMQRAEYPQEDFMRLHGLGIHYKFHLVHSAQEPVYDPTWRLFYPASVNNSPPLQTPLHDPSQQP